MMDRREAEAEAEVKARMGAIETRQGRNPTSGDSGYWQNVQKLTIKETLDEENSSDQEGSLKGEEIKTI